MTREALSAQLDQARIDLRHAQYAAEDAQNPSDRDFARSVVAQHQRRINGLLAQVRGAR